MTTIQTTTSRKPDRTEFGASRTSCDCAACQLNCRFIPGFLIPSDLTRLLPADPVEAYTWAEANLLASPGALVSKNGRQFRVHTLVPAVKPDGSCINLTEAGRCAIHDNAPFGCAFFDCGPERSGLAQDAITAVLQDWLMCGPYSALWCHLANMGRNQHAPEVLRARMQRELIWIVP